MREAISSLHAPYSAEGKACVLQRFLALVAVFLSLYAVFMDYSKIITIEPGKRGGKPCIRGMRITVTDVLEYLASGMTENQVLNDFPELKSEDIYACLAFAAEREKRLTGSVA